MLQVLNHLCHGYVWVPVANALEAGGVFRTLAAGPRSIVELAAELSANPGPLRAALEMFLVQGSVTLDGDRYALGPEAMTDLHDVAGIEELYEMSPVELVRTLEGGQRLVPWIEKALAGWGQDAALSLLLDGPIVLPTLIGLGQADLVDALVEGDEAELPPVAAIRRFLLARKWAGASDDGGFVLNGAGKFMIGRAMNGGVAASYWPLLRHMPELLFGDADAVMAEDSGHEGHVDRSLNVRSSGFQHEKYFADMEKVIVALFSEGWHGTARPGYVADMGCGDGTLLKGLHEALKKQDAGDICLLGLDLNEAALTETAKTLAGTTHLLMRADIADPKSFAHAFTEKTGDQPGCVLHVRSFLDHDRTYISAKDCQAVSARERLPFAAAGVQAGGELVSPAELYQNLVEHLSQWAEILEGHGLLCLEVHTMSRWAKKAYFELSEGFYFDAIQALSRQYLCEPAAFVAAMAEAGLFPERHFTRYPRGLPYTRMTLGYYERCPWKIRFAAESDVARLRTMSWALKSEFDPEVAVELARTNPGACFVLEDDDRRLLGALFCRESEFDQGSRSREVVLSEGAAEGGNWELAIARHVATYYSVQDGATLVSTDVRGTSWAWPSAASFGRVRLVAEQKGPHGSPESGAEIT